jgi:RNA polymerase sigma factor (sigma-70 family)
MTINEYNQIFEEYRMRVFFFCKKILNNQMDAEDATSMVFINLWSIIDEAHTENIKAFLMIAAKNKCLDILKANSRFEYKKTLHPEWLMPDTLDDPFVDVLTLIYNALKTLTPQQREVFELKHTQDCSISKISQILKMKPQTASNVLLSAHARIKKHLQAQGINHRF